MIYDYELLVVRRVVDGDTVDLTLGREIDFGFYLIEFKRFTTRFRLLGVDTPERGQPGWGEATAFTETWLAERFGRLRVTTTKADSFGRWLATVYVDGELEPSLNQALLDSRHAVEYRR